MKIIFRTYLVSGPFVNDLDKAKIQSVFGHRYVRTRNIMTCFYVRDTLVDLFDGGDALNETKITIFSIHNLWNPLSN